MKKLTLAVSAAVALAASGSAMAQNSGVLEVTGSIPSYCTLNISNIGGFDLLLNDWQDVAEVTGTCNSGLPNVLVEYTAQIEDQNNPGFAAFEHENALDWISFDGRVAPPGGGTVTPVGLSTYGVQQVNGSAHDVSFRPYGANTNVAGNYQTDILIEVYPN